MEYIQQICSQMFKFAEIQLAGITFLASNERFLWQPDTETLIISDTHFGKVSHFRKHGIPLSQAAKYKDFHRLEKILDYYLPNQVVFMGDLFHSEMNIEWRDVIDLLEKYPHTRFTLVEGNHDILHPQFYERAKLVVSKKVIFENTIEFTHDPPAKTVNPTICGHVHPGFRLTGKARQSLKFPCFFLRNELLILPAFSSLSGLHVMNKKSEQDHVWIVTPEEIYKV